MKYLTEPPIGILLTMPVAFFEDRGWSVEDFEKYYERFMRNEEHIWNYRKKTLPVHDVLYCYLVFGGCVKFRSNIVGYERNVAKTFYDDPDLKPRNFSPSNWIILNGVARPPHPIPMKGFQGFRYVTKELW